jgi:hypothetical protein
MILLNGSKNKKFNIWEYLYYRVVIIYSKIESKAGFEYNKDSGAWVVAVCLIANILTVLLSLIFILPVNFSLDEKGYLILKIVLIGIILIILWYSYKYFTNKNHYKIFKKYKNESLKQMKKRGWLIFVYVVLSFIALFKIVVLGHSVNTMQ